MNFYILICLLSSTLGVKIAKIPLTNAPDSSNYGYEEISFSNKEVFFAGDTATGTDLLSTPYRGAGWTPRTHSKIMGVLDDANETPFFETLVDSKKVYVTDAETLPGLPLRMRDNFHKDINQLKIYSNDWFLDGSNVKNRLGTSIPVPLGHQVVHASKSGFITTNLTAVIGTKSVVGCTFDGTCQTVIRADRIRFVITMTMDQVPWFAYHDIGGPETYIIANFDGSVTPLPATVADDIGIGFHVANNRFIFHKKFPTYSETWISNFDVFDTYLIQNRSSRPLGMYRTMTLDRCRILVETTFEGRWVINTCTRIITDVSTAFSDYAIGAIATSKGRVYAIESGITKGTRSLVKVRQLEPLAFDPILSCTLDVGSITNKDPSAMGEYPMITSDTPYVLSKDQTVLYRIGTVKIGETRLSCGSTALPSSMPGSSTLPMPSRPPMSSFEPEIPQGNQVKGKSSFGIGAVLGGVAAGMLIMGGAVGVAGMMAKREEKRGKERSEAAYTAFVTPAGNAAMNPTFKPMDGLDV